MKNNIQQGSQLFVPKLFALLTQPSNFQIIKWSQQKKGFKIFDVKSLQENLLPKYFRHAKYASFVRQLNMYDFHKIREQNGQTVFYHQKFTQLKEQLLDFIIRKGNTKKYNQNKQNREGYSKKRNLENLVEQLIQQVRNSIFGKQSSRQDIQKQVQKLRNLEKYSVLRSRKYLNQIYQKLNLCNNNNKWDNLSIDEEIQQDEMMQNGFKSLSFLRSQGFIKRAQNLFHLD